MKTVQGEPGVGDQAASAPVTGSSIWGLLTGTLVISGLRGVTLQPSPSSYSLEGKGHARSHRKSCLVHRASPRPAWRPGRQAGSLGGDVNNMPDNTKGFVSWLPVTAVPFLVWGEGSFREGMVGSEHRESDGVGGVLPSLASFAPTPRRREEEVCDSTPEGPTLAAW